MGLNYTDAVRLGLGHLHPAVNGGKSKEKELLDRVYASEKPPSRAPDDGMSKLERRFRDAVLEPALVRGDIGKYWREPVKLRLGGRTWYTPDWLVISGRAGEHGIPPRFTFVEIKGFMRDDAAVKLKVAADKYPCWGWLLVTRDRWGWDVREVTSGGIGREPIHVPWIHGC